MNNFHGLEIPIRSKINMLNDIIQILYYLNLGDRDLADPIIDDLKCRAVFLDEQIQEDVLRFSEQVHFQYAYDPKHLLNREVEVAADKLIEDMGFNLDHVKK